jgi:hypothetical protein
MVVVETGFYSPVQFDWETRSGTLGAIEHCTGQQMLDPSDDEVAPPPKPAPRKAHKGAGRESVRISVEAQRVLLAESGATGKPKRKEPPTPEQVF